MTNTLDKETIEKLAIQCGASLRESGSTAKPIRMFSITGEELQAFVNELTTPQEAIIWIDEFGNIENSFKPWMADEPNVKWTPLFKATPNYETLVKENERLREMWFKYNELIMQVGSKFPDETRHETALRYIKKAESGSNQPDTGYAVNEALAKGE